MTRTTTLFFAAIMLAACSPLRPAVFPHPPASITGTTLTRDDAIADLDTLMRTLENVHPDLYAVRKKADVDAHRREIVANLPATMSRTEWWLRLAPLTAGFGDGHTNVWYPGDEVIRQLNAGALVFPPSVALDDAGHVVITSNITREAGLARADRVLAVNGFDADSLVRAWARDFSGESDLYRTTIVTDQFRDLMTVHGMRAPFTLRVATGSAPPRDVASLGVTRDSFTKITRPASTAANTTGTVARNFAYRTLPGGVGYMNFRTMGGDLETFAADVTKMFAQAQADSVRALIVDLRTNGGGDSRLGDELLRHITTTAYRGAARKDWRMSAEYRTFILSRVKVPLRWLHIEYFVPMGRRMFTGAPGKVVSTEWPPRTYKKAEPFFARPVCFLVGPRTFSSAVTLADAVKTYHLATIIGEETGGRPTGFGEVYPFVLPRSGFSVSSSSARFVRASGDSTDHRGVVPDVFVRPNAADRAAGRDVVLERAQSCGAN